MKLIEYVRKHAHDEANEKRRNRAAERMRQITSLLEVGPMHPADIMRALGMDAREFRYRRGALRRVGWIELERDYNNCYKKHIMGQTITVPPVTGRVKLTTKYFRETKDINNKTEDR